MHSPRGSARKHAAALEISDRTVRRILHEELRFHPYKMAVVQQLTEREKEIKKLVLQYIVLITRLKTFSFSE